MPASTAAQREEAVQINIRDSEESTAVIEDLQLKLNELREAKRVEAPPSTHHT